MICDKNVPMKLKHKIYRTAVRPTIWCMGPETWTMRKTGLNLMCKTEMRMLRWVQGVSLEQEHNLEIREAASVIPMDTHLTRRRL